MELREEIICEKRSYSKALDTHDHKYSQLMFPLSGSIYIKANERELKLNQGCFYIPPSCLHTYHALERNEFLVLDVPATYFTVQQEFKQSIYIETSEYWSSIRYLLLEHFNQHDQADSLHHLVKYINHSLSTRALHKSVQYIHSYFYRDIKLEQLAAMENYHPAYFSAWFKKQMGYSPQDYIHHVRLKEAKQLLEHTSWPITMIAHEVGYQTLSSFTKWFRQKENQSPTSFRNNLKSKQVKQ
ncbi:helix-turn-helix transcriptional regulator [Priestia megaterium]|nr:helix-turn-helix transcriptional regulator [Priestia megaterium]